MLATQFTQPKSTPDKDSDPRLEIIVIHERFWVSLISDAITYLTVISVIGTGWLMGSDAMQWAGFIMLFFILIAATANKNKKMTIAQARLKLDELEKESR